MGYAMCLGRAAHMNPILLGLAGAFVHALDAAAIDVANNSLPHGESGKVQSTSGSVALPMCSVVLEVANTVGVTFLLTELLLRRCRLHDVRWSFAVLMVLNVILSPRVHRILGVFVSAVWASGESVAGNAGSSTSQGDAKAPFGLATVFDIASMLSNSRAYMWVLRLITIATGFSTLTYFDVRRLREQPYTMVTFFYELKGAVALVLPVFPFLVMGFSCVFLIIVSLLMKIGLPSDVGDEFIFYGQFYAPFSAVYWLMKKDWLADERKRSVLPLSSGNPRRAKQQRAD